ncbi:MAG: ABC-F family ATP-binding cassette domain-containing protein [Candidatus Doudnabacteria bacterium]
MASNDVILRFSEVSFDYGHNKEILEEASFSVRTDSKIALMGQNGAGKSSIFGMITGENKPKEGSIHLTPKDVSIGVARQVVSDQYKELNVREYFETAFPEKKYNLDKLIKDVFEVVNADYPLDKKIKEFSGGQQARLLLAYALIQDPDILLLDEPTNNLDQTGIDHLMTFLIMYPKTVLIISHDADFLNAFTDGVLYLDVHTHKVEQYTGNYFDVVEEIANRVERENLQNARMEQNIKKLKAQAEQFAHKGGKLRAVAKKMRDEAGDLEENKVEVRREDKTIPDFEIPAQEFTALFDGKVVNIKEVTAIKNHKQIHKPIDLILRRNTHLLIKGPNGIGKSTFLEALATGKAKGVTIPEVVSIGYYRQDFSTLNYEHNAFESLYEVMEKKDEHVLRSTAARFLLDGKILETKVRALSEGQKGLLSFARLVLQKPGLLILDEPTNHINFRHLPIIAKALNDYKGAMIMVSHIPDFVKQIRIDEYLDLGSI